MNWNKDNMSKALRQHHWLGADPTRKPKGHVGDHPKCADVYPYKESREERRKTELETRIERSEEEKCIKKFQQGRNGDADVENGPVDTVWEGKSGMNWKSSIDIYTLSCVKQIWLTECLKNYGQRFVTLYRGWWSRPSPRKRNGKRQMVVWGDLTKSWGKKEREKLRAKEKRKDIPECRVPKNSKER